MLMYDDSESLSYHFDQCIVETLKRCRMLKKPHPSRVGMPWMTDEIKQLIRRRNRARHYDDELYKTLRRQVKSAIRKSRKHCFHNFLKEVDAEHSISRTFVCFE